MEVVELENREWVLSAYADQGVPTSNHLNIRSVNLSVTVDLIPDGHVMVQILYLSVDPYLRTRMTGHSEGLYFPQFELDQVVTGFAVGRVILSKDSGYEKGDIILNPFSPMAEYCVWPSDSILRKVDHPKAAAAAAAAASASNSKISLPDYLSALGVPGFTAWIGIELLGKPKPKENVFISAAAGGVGMFAGQLAKLKGCRVVGSTGSDEKVKLLKEEFGYDEAFNYNKETDFDAALTKYFPDGIDIYFENVGGKMLETVLNHVNIRARIPICGMISEYNQVWSERKGVRNLLNMVGKEVKMEGFLVRSYLNHWGDFAKEMEGYILEGKIHSKHKIYIGIESFLESLASLFTSSNVGKVIIQVHSY